MIPATQNQCRRRWERFTRKRTNGRAMLGTRERLRAIDEISDISSSGSLAYRRLTSSISDSFATCPFPRKSHPTCIGIVQICLQFCFVIQTCLAGPLGVSSERAAWPGTTRLWHLLLLNNDSGHEQDCVAKHNADHEKSSLG